MVLPLLQFLQDQKMYPDKDLFRAKLQLVSKTKMVDCAIEDYKSLYEVDEAPEGMMALRTEAHRQIKDWAEGCSPLLDFCGKEAYRNTSKEFFNMEHLKREEQVKDENLPNLYKYAKLNFDCGLYQRAADYLFCYRLLSTDEDTKFLALWGKLSAEILMMNEDAALEDLESLEKLITKRGEMRVTRGGGLADRAVSSAVGESVGMDHLEQLQQRTWLMHWALFLFSQLEEEGQAQMLEFLFHDKIMNALQTTSPHMLRYLAAAAIICKRKQNRLKDVVQILQQEREAYSDPITEFLFNLYHEFDFEAAQAKLEQCEEVLNNDFFLTSSQDLFMESARMLMFETYCRIHKRISISQLGIRLGLPQDEHLTPTIVRYIKDARVDAKIDSNKNQIVMGTSPLSIYQQVIEGTKHLQYRSDLLLQSIEKKQQLNE